MSESSTLEFEGVRGNKEEDVDAGSADVSTVGSEGSEERLLTVFDSRAGEGVVVAASVVVSIAELGSGYERVTSGVDDTEFDWVFVLGSVS